MNRRYLRGLDLPEIHIYDRDNDRGYRNHVDAVNRRDNRDWATLTSKREIENYLHPAAVRDVLGIDMVVDDDIDVPLIVARAIHEASESPIAWDDVEEDKRGRKASQAKRRLCHEVIARMTLAQLRERDRTNEVEGWCRRISERLV